MILSASRRTDIPAFYAEWFMNRLRSGYVYVRNPMNSGLISAVPLTPVNVDCIVFWTKDPRPFIAYLDEIDAMGYRYYFQFTITPYGRDVETGIAGKRGIVDSFRALSNRIGKSRVILRYDPVFLREGGEIDIKFHIKAFERLCQILYPYTEKVVFSFLDGYRKIAKNIKSLRIRELEHEEKLCIAEGFAEIVCGLGLRLETCAENIELSRFGIAHSKCVDGELIEKIIGRRIRSRDSRAADRESCNCMKSIDIGQYNTCMHGCAYCYANTGVQRAKDNYECHIATSPILVGDFDMRQIKPRSEADTKSLII